MLYFKLHDGTIELFNPLVVVPRYFGETTDNVPTEIFLSNIPGNRIVVDENSSGAFIFFIVARDINSNETGYFFNYAVLFKDVDGVTTLFNSPGQVNLDTGDPATFAWTGGFDIVNNNELRFMVTGENGKTIAWSTSQIRLTQVTE